MSSKCAQCKEPAYVGTRCFSHYVRNLARDRGLLKYAWFEKKFKRFVGALHGRFLLTRLAGGPPDQPLDEFVRQIWTTDPRPFWLTHSKTRGHTVQYRGKSREELFSLIHTVEAKAKENVA